MVNIFRYTGFGVESNFGTAVDATFHIDQASVTLDTPSAPEIMVPSGMGRAPRVKVPGFYYPSGNVDYAFDIETVGWFLRWALPGGYVYTGASTLHELYGTDTLTPQSFTTRVGKDVLEHTFAGCVMNSLALSVDNGLTNASLGIMAQKDSKATIKSGIGDLTLPADAPMTFADVSVEVNSEDYNAVCKSFTLNINNNTNADTGRTVGSRFPSGYQFAGRDVTCNMSLLFPDTEMMTLFWGNASTIQNCGSTELPIEITIAQNCPTNSRALTILLPNTVMEQARQQPRGRDNLLQEISVRAMVGNDVVLNDASTVDTDILCSLVNGTGTMA